VDGADVSDWFQWGRTELASTTLSLPLGMVVTPCPGDFRSPDEIAHQAEYARRIADAS
jgi:hypothetical protein